MSELPLVLGVFTSSDAPSTSSTRNIIIQNERDRGGMIGVVDSNNIGSYPFAHFLGMSQHPRHGKLLITEFDYFENQTKCHSDTTWRELLVVEPVALAAGVNEVRDKTYSLLITL